MTFEKPTYVEKDGEILPNYEGDINGPRDARGVPVAEREDFFDSEDDLYSGEVMSPQALRAFEMAQKAKGSAAIEAAKDKGIIAFSEALREERKADRAGTYFGTSPSDYPDSRTPISPALGGTTIRQGQRNAARHVVQARKDRWGR